MAFCFSYQHKPALEKETVVQFRQLSFLAKIQTDSIFNLICQNHSSLTGRQFQSKQSRPFLSKLICPLNIDILFNSCLTDALEIKEAWARYILGSCKKFLIIAFFHTVLNHKHPDRGPKVHELLIHFSDNAGTKSMKR